MIGDINFLSCSLLGLILCYFRIVSIILQRNFWLFLHLTEKMSTVNITWTHSTSICWPSYWVPDIVRGWDIMVKRSKQWSTLLIREMQIKTTIRCHFILARLAITSSVQFSRSVVSDSLQCYELQHARSPCPPPTPRIYPNMSIELVMPSNHLILCCPLLLLPSIFPSIKFFPKSQFFTSGGQRIGVSASASVLRLLLLSRLSRVQLCASP